MEEIKRMQQDHTVKAAMSSVVTPALSQDATPGQIRDYLVQRGVFSKQEADAVPDSALGKIVERLRQADNDMIDATAFGFDRASGKDWTPKATPKVNDTVSFGGRTYRIRKITHKDLVLREVK